jgi:SOS response regulatory protein OraA/RecX
LKGLESRAQYQKLAAYLSRKGFRYNQVKLALDELLLASNL